MKFYKEIDCQIIKIIKSGFAISESFCYALA